MATTYRLNAFTIFLILLATLLIAYLFNHVWENFMCRCNKKEGFGTLDGYGETVGGYSLNNKKVVNLYENVYFDPIGKNFVETLDGNQIRITDRNNNESVHQTKQSQIATADTEVTKDNFDWEAYIAKYEDLRDAGIDTLDGAFQHYSSQGGPVENREAKVFINSNYEVPTLATNATSFIYLAKVPDGENTKHAFIHVPVTKSDESITDVTYIHVMDLEKKKHIKTFHFFGSDIESRDVQTNMLESGYADFSDLKGTNLGNFGKSDKELSDHFTIQTKHMTSKKAIRIIVTKKDEDEKSGFKAFITFASANIPILARIEHITGKPKTNDNDSDDDSDCENERKDKDKDLIKKIKQYKSLQSSLFGFGEMRSPYFDYEGSPYSDFILKTEVVPPVCPECPSCPGNTVCIHGKRDSTTNQQGSVNNEQGSVNKKGDSAKSLARDLGSGVNDLIRDGASGTTNLARDATTGTVQIAKDTVAGTSDFVKDSASGIGEYAKDVASGTYGVASDVVKGTVGLGREIVGGLYGTASDVVKGTVGIGQDVVGGIAQGIPNYGSPHAGMNVGPSPNVQMGGYYNSYGGGYINPQMPQTAGQDPYGYYGAVPARSGNSINYVPRTADFSSFGK